MNAHPPRPTGPPSAADLLMVLRFAERASKKALAAELAGSGVHIGQELVLAKLLGHGSLPVARLAGMLDVEVPTATKTTQRMEAAGLVRRVRGGDGVDARQVAIELTETGAEVALTVRRMHTRAGRRMLKGLDAGERAQLNDLLWKVVTNIDDHG